MALALGLATAAGATPSLVPVEAFAPHIRKFNAMEPETVINAVPDAKALDWLSDYVPRFICPDPKTEETYWFRWWALRKHLQKEQVTGRWVFTEFITRPRPVSSGLGHHLMEGRWLREQSWHDDYILYWLRGNNGGPEERFHRYSQWVQHALWSRWLVTQDTSTLVGLLDDLVADYRRWEEAKRRPDGLFWQHDVWDAMEESISGGRKVKNVRPTISVYMYGNAVALAEVARLAGRDELVREFTADADRLRALVQHTLWNPDLQFFGSVTEELQPIAVREAIGFIPWYFHLPEAGRGYEIAWRQVTDEAGFKAPWGLTTAERRHPKFRSHGTGTCEWDGAVWPFATSQTLTAMANLLRDYPQNVVTKHDWLEAFDTYTKSHVYDGLPYIGEYQDETTGAWLKGRDPRSFYYNHSTYADLLIMGLVGLRPRADDIIELTPLLPPDTWPWFCLDRVRYHGRELTIIWDRDGTKFERGAGLAIYLDGREIARREELGSLWVRLP